MVKVSFGNKKLPRDTMIFNIPAVRTCPGRTVLCEKACYALKAERAYKDVYPARKHNLKLTQSLEFIGAFSDTISRYRRRFKRVRFHESGDYYSQQYLERCFEIAKKHQDVTFYAYTKSFALDFRNKPDNFVLIASFDKTSTARDHGLYALKRKWFDNTFTIVDKTEAADCIQDCKKCDRCWTERGADIKVNQH